MHSSPLRIDFQIYHRDDNVISTTGHVIRPAVRSIERDQLINRWMFRIAIKRLAINLNLTNSSDKIIARDEMYKYQVD